MFNKIKNIYISKLLYLVHKIVIAGENAEITCLWRCNDEFITFCYFQE